MVILLVSWKRRKKALASETPLLGFAELPPLRVRRLAWPQSNQTPPVSNISIRRESEV